MVRAIIFDWHGVFDQTTFAMFRGELALLTRRSPEEIHRLIAEDERLYASGQLDSRIFWDNLREKLRLSNDDLTSIRVLLLSYDPNSELWKLLPKFPSRVTLGILSDCPPEKIETIRRIAPLHYFKATHFSGEIKLTKKIQNSFLESQKLWEEMLQSVYM